MTQSHAIVSDPFTVKFTRIKARQLCRRTDFSESDCDDLQQGMRLYLLEKAHLFDPDRGNIEAFVTNALNSWVAMELRNRGRLKRRDSHKAASLDSTPVECDGDITSLGAVLLEEDGRRLSQSYGTSAIEEFERREAIDYVMNGLQPQQRALLLYVPAAPYAAWVSTANDPLFAPEHLSEQRVFTSVLTLTYRVLR